MEEVDIPETKVVKEKEMDVEDIAELKVDEIIEI